jgi:hypothetical protein
MRIDMEEISAVVTMIRFRAENWIEVYSGDAKLEKMWDRIGNSL